MSKEKCEICKTYPAVENNKCESCNGVLNHRKEQEIQKKTGSSRWFNYGDVELEKLIEKAFNKTIASLSPIAHQVVIINTKIAQLKASSYMFDNNGAISRLREARAHYIKLTEEILIDGDND